MAKIEVGIGILAGGKSRRMGKDKVFLPWEDKNFLETILEKCSVFPDIYLSVANKDGWDKNYGVTGIVEDELPDYGPLEGIYQILCASKQEYVLMLAADMPNISRELLLELTGLVTGEEDCLALVKDNYPEILCSIYSKRILPIAEAMRENGEHRPIRIFERSDTRYVDIDELGFSKQIVENINTPEEYERMIREKEQRQ